MAVVYQHIRKDTNEVFYIGIGKTIARSKSKISRNSYWHNIVNLCGYEIEIIHNNITWGEACELEKIYIQKFGRKDLGLGPLVNMTDGGDGISNISDETRKKMATNIGKKLSQTTIEKMRISQTGRKHKKETIEKMKISQLGEKNHMFNKNHKIHSKMKMGISRQGEKNHNSKLTESDVIYIRNEYLKGNITTYQLAEQFKVSRVLISSVLKRKTWKHI